MKNVLYGKCVKCGKTYPATPDLTTCGCGGILDITYDYDYIKTQRTMEKLAERTEMCIRDRASSQAVGAPMESACWLIRAQPLLMSF